MALIVSTLVRPFKHPVQEKYLYSPVLSQCPMSYNIVLLLLTGFPGPDKGGYYHKLFLLEDQPLARGIERKAIGFRKSNSPESHPNFYSQLLLPTITAGQTQPLARVQPTCNQFEMAAFTTASDMNDSQKPIRRATLPQEQQPVYSTMVASCFVGA